MCELISEKYRNQINEDAEEHWIFDIREYLLSKGLTYGTSLPEQIRSRRSGKRFSFEDHVKALIYAMLTNQRKWYYVEPHLSEIDELFFEYNPEKILEKSAEYYCEQLCKIKCGNRGIKSQMEALPDNLRTFRRIEKDFGSLDAFVSSEPANEIVKKLSDTSSKYKIKELGPALAWEYLRNVGIDGAKPDVHLRRFFGNDRMGTCGHDIATEKEVINQVVLISEKTGLLQAEVDNLIWSFCADGYGEICTASPRCRECPISKNCKRKAVK